MAWWDSYRAVYRAELKASALGFADHGWPVLPGTYWEGGSWAGAPLVGGGAASAGTASASEPTPTAVSDSGAIPAVAASTRPDTATGFGGIGELTQDRCRISDWWSARPYSVLLATGITVDAIEVPALVGRRVCALLRRAGVLAPVAATPTGRWWFLVLPGEPLRPELASRVDVLLHGRGSWLAAPPSEGPRGVVHWRVPPSACRWRPPPSCDLQSALLEVLRQRRTGTGHGSRRLGTDMRFS